MSVAILVRMDSGVVIPIADEHDNVYQFANDKAATDYMADSMLSQMPWQLVELEI